MDPDEVVFFEKLGLTYIETIAKGGYGLVYLVHSDNYQSYFAMKKIPEKLFNEAEVNCLKTIYDPNIVVLYNYYKFQNYIYMLMEYCPTDLEKIMKHQKLFSKEELLKYSKEIVQSVCACHSKNIAHCDIKPANFLVDKYGRLKIGDFGLSSVYDDGYTCDLFKGTIIFMAPEVFGSEEYNPIISDVWAVGVTLYLLATRKYPFFSHDVEELKKQIASGKFSETEVEDILLRDVIIRCLDTNPKYRITCSEILEMPYFKPKQLPEISLSTINRINSNVFIVKPRIFERKSLFAILKSSHLNVLEHRCHK